jgi:hypothetical protein
MITRRFVLSGLVAAPAVIAADKLMPVHSLPKRYATVWGVGHDLEVVEHVVWDQQGALDFWKFNGGIDKFREVTDIVYGFKMPPLPKPVTQPHWHVDPLARFGRPVDDSRGIPNITGYNQLNAWRESLRPDLDGRDSVEWIQEQIKAERKFLGS